MLKNFELYRILKDGKLKLLEITRQKDIEGAVKHLRITRGNGEYTIIDRQLEKEYTVVAEDNESRYWESLCN